MDGTYKIELEEHRLGCKLDITTNQHLVCGCWTAQTDLDTADNLVYLQTWRFAMER